MTTTVDLNLELEEDLLFPDSDGKPMADNTEQYEWIVKIKENLEILFAENPQVFIAGDLLWYPVFSALINPVAPDVMVVFGRPKGRRGSYRQWREENLAPQVVFEILSPKNTKKEMKRKKEFYQTYGAEEYYVYNPNPKKKKLEGWLRQGEQLREIEEINGFISPRLGIRFELKPSGLEIYRPDGEKFLTSVELAAIAQQAQFEAQQERQRAEILAQRLRELGINPDEL
jgi:Uma2 family endonuclease